jgi:hypothetical protein
VRHLEFITASGIALVASIGSSCNLDPVHRASVNALGGENADAYPIQSQYHRPGEPCVLCHGADGPANTQFVLGGTVFWGPDSYENRVDKAYVRVEDARKTTHCFVTNCNGNFFVTADEFPGLTFPLLISVERTKQPGNGDESTLVIQPMSGHIGREASCANCHIQGLRDFGSPGQIYMYATEATEQMANPPIVQCPPPDGYQVLTLCPEDRQ